MFFGPLIRISLIVGSFSSSSSGPRPNVSSSTSSTSRSRSLRLSSVSSVSQRCSTTSRISRRNTSPSSSPTLVRSSLSTSLLWIRRLRFFELGCLALFGRPSGAVLIAIRLRPGQSKQCGRVQCGPCSCVGKRRGGASRRITGAPRPGRNTAQLRGLHGAPGNIACGFAASSCKPKLADLQSAGRQSRLRSAAACAAIRGRTDARTGELAAVGAYAVGVGGEELRWMRAVALAAGRFLFARPRFSQPPIADLPTSAIFFRLVRVAGQGLAQRDDRLRDRRLGSLLDQRHAVVSDFDHRAVVVRQLPEDLAAHRFFGLFQTDLVVQSRRD